jgi:hypothetical protein
VAVEKSFFFTNDLKSGDRKCLTGFFIYELDTAFISIARKPSQGR